MFLKIQIAFFDGVCSFSLSNTSENILSSDKNLVIGGYAQIDGNFSLDDSNKMNANGKLDIHRLVTFLGYKFNDRITFVSEIEYEHVVELYVEQAFLIIRSGKHELTGWFDVNSNGNSKLISRATYIQWC